MRRILFTLAAVLATAAFGPSVLAQAQPRPTIHNVTLDEGSGVLTITGVGFGQDAAVTVDGQPVAVLQGGSETRLDVLAPARLLMTPGSYRLTVVDPTRQIGDAFVVASPTMMTLPSRVQPADTRAAESQAAPTAAAPLAVSSSSMVRQAGGEPSLQTAIEDPGSPWRTALGYQALFSNTVDGQYNTAIGYRALFSDTSGFNNTASGVYALGNNTTGSLNTASGLYALLNNTTGDSNTATGAGALESNSTGANNTASGYAALGSNSTGVNNVASGYGALRSNTTGLNNTASGVEALRTNVAGNDNFAGGYQTLYSNTGDSNTATGTQALLSNTSGAFNTATGTFALKNSTTGSRNTALGHNAGLNATTGSYNLFLGAAVQGAVADTNTIRIGLPYIGGVGQNKTFVAGIYNTALDASNGVQSVWVDQNGQLGTLMPTSAGGSTPVPLQASKQRQTVVPQASPGEIEQLTRTVQAQQVVIADLRGLSQEQQAVNAELRARLARLEALLVPATGRNVAR